MCIGSFLLAAAGVLDGRRAATHWMHAPLLATRHPQVAVEPDAIFVRDGRVWSSAGVTTGIDLALALIEEDAGRQVAMNVARMLVVYLKRTGGQSQYSALLAAQVQSESETFDSLERWIAEHLNGDLRVGALAEQVHMSPRNFARAYAEKRGRTPAKAVEAIRVEAARRRLEETEDRIESVAEASGFSNEEQMRCSFIRILGIPPREYRNTLPPPSDFGISCRGRQGIRRYQVDIGMHDGACIQGRGIDLVVRKARSPRLDRRGRERRSRQPMAGHLA